MDKQLVLELVKKDLHQVIKDLTLPRIPEAKKRIQSYLVFLDELKILEDIEIPEDIKPPTLTGAARDEFIDEVIQAIENPAPKEVVSEPVRLAHRFERKIKGGALQDIGAFVPEKVVRELELEHGDLVFAKKLVTDIPYDGPTRYEFEVAEYRDEPKPKDRVQIDYAIVAYDATLGRFKCDKTIDGKPIRLGEVMHTVLISEKEVIDYQIKDGDIVDLAYNKNSTDNIRVIWRYSIEQRGDFLEPAKPTTKKKADKLKKEYPQTLVGKTVLMVGFEPGRPSMQEEVERRGGELIWASGREGYDRMHTLINKADCVINMLEHMGHRGSINGVDIAKTLNKPHGRLHTFGRTSFIQEVYNCLEIDSPE